MANKIPQSAYKRLDSRTFIPSQTRAMNIWEYGFVKEKKTGHDSQLKDSWIDHLAVENQQQKQ